MNWGETVARDVAFIQMTGTKHYGLQPDMGYEGLPDEVEQVRRHHEMLARLIADESTHFKI